MTAEPFPDGERGGGDGGRTAVGAGFPENDPVEAMLRAVNALTVAQIVEFLRRLREEYDL